MIGVFLYFLRSTWRSNSTLQGLRYKMLANVWKTNPTSGPCLRGLRRLIFSLRVSFIKYLFCECRLSQANDSIDCSLLFSIAQVGGLFNSFVNFCLLFVYVTSFDSKKVCKMGNYFLFSMENWFSICYN